MARRTALAPDQQTAFNDALFTGISRKDMNMIRVALENGAEPNLLLFEGITYKRTLSDRWNETDTDQMRLDWVKTAVEAGADVNATRKAYNDYVWPAIHWLHDNFNAKIMDYMIAGGAGVDQPDPNNETMLMRAVHEGKYDLVEYYLKKGADPMRPCKDGKEFPLQALEQGDKFKKDKKATLLMEMMQHVKHPPVSSSQTAVMVVQPLPPVAAPETGSSIEAPQVATFKKEQQKPQERHGFSI